MGIEQDLNQVSVLLQKLLDELSKQRLVKNNHYIDYPTAKIIEEFNNGIKSLEYLKKEIKKSSIPHYLSFKDIKLMTGLSRSTVERMQKAGTFPSKRILGGNTTRWLSSEIEEWLISRERVFT